MKETLIEAIDGALLEGQRSGAIKSTALPDVILERPKREGQGDFSTNVAMQLKKGEGRPPREIAEGLVPLIEGHELIERCEVAGPGFINIFIKPAYWAQHLLDILSRGEEFGNINLGKGEKVQVEFVSANPTGPLHIGHARGAAVGGTLSNILRAAGFDVTCEYYINDVGNQMNVLGRTLQVRYLELLGVEVEHPEEFYKGDYMEDIARDFITKHGDIYRDKEVGDEESLGVFRTFASASILAMIRNSLEEYGIEFDVWYSEKTLHDRNLVETSIEELRHKGVVYDRDGAVWFKTTDFGDDKDRVLVKADGAYTYFASDVAYHREKLERGFTKIIDIWGADHHGYEARVRGLIRALGMDSSALGVIFIQLVSLTRDKVPVQMSTRSGEFVTLKEVMDEVGRDACRFFFLMRKSDAHLDFDLELAKREAPENPVFYIQYSHARICSILERAVEAGMVEPEAREGLLGRLEEAEEVDLIKYLGSFEEMIAGAAITMEPHRVAFYLQELASKFHSFYSKHKVVGEDSELSGARLLLCRSVKIVVAKGLDLLGVSAPEKM